jgi:hypothetical protein
MADHSPSLIDHPFFIFLPHHLFMASSFGHGFITSIMLIAKHFALPTDQAWFGAADHLDGLVVPDQFKGTEVDELVTLLRKKVVWHQPGTMDKEDARDVIATLNRLVLAIDRALGIKDPDIGSYH